MRSKARIGVLAAVMATTVTFAMTGLSGASSNNGENNILPPVTSAHPHSGGTLKIVGNGDVDHFDTCCAYYTTTYELLRMVSRQLVSYAATNNPTGQVTPVPDLATWTVSSNGLVYTFKIKAGALWDTPTGPRQVTSNDEVRGIKRLCNPVTPAPPLQYWEGNIAGMTAFCTGFNNISLSSNPATEVTQLNNYMNTNNMSGLTAPNPSTVVFTLMHPASSFLNILAMPMSSPVPVEATNYLPASVQLAQNWVSDGPYTVTGYTPNVSYTLAKNPDWKQGADPIRHQYFNAVDVTMGETATAVQQQLENGDADLEWDTTVPTAEVPSLASSHNKGLAADFIGGIDYLAFNMQSTTNNGALAKASVREALQYCVDKRHAIQVEGGPVVNAPSNQILTPQMTAGFQTLNTYATANDDAGNAAKCKSMLASAGYPSGLTLTLTFPNNPPYPALATALQSDFAKGGVTIKFDEQPTQGEYFTYIETPSNKSSWDLALGLWFPDWDGNGAQSYISPLLDGRLYTNGSTNYGDYNDATVNHYIDTALTTGSVSKAGSAWAALDKYAMTKNPPWIPLLDIALPQFVGTHVQHAIYVPFLGYVDPTNLWTKS